MSSNSEPLLSQGMAAEERGDIATAERLYRDAAEHGNADAANCLGLLLEQKGEYDAAIGAFEQSIAAGSIEAEINLALLFDAIGRWEDARQLFTRSSERGDSRAILDLAFALWRHEEYTDAELAFTDAAQANVPRAYLHLGFLLAELDERSEDALDAFQRALTLGVSDAATQVGWQLSRLGRLAEAEAVLWDAFGAGDLTAGDLLRDVLEALDRAEEAEALRDVLAERATTLSMEYRTLLADLDREPLYEEDLEEWAAAERYGDTPAVIAALEFDAPRLSQAETRLELMLETTGAKEARETLIRLYELTGRLASAERLRQSLGE